MKYLSSALLILVVLFSSGCITEELPDLFDLPPTIDEFFSDPDADFLRIQSALVTNFNVNRRNLRIDFSSDYDTFNMTQQNAVTGIEVTSDHGYTEVLSIQSRYFVDRTLLINRTYCYYLAYKLSTGVTSKTTPKYCVLVD